MTDIGGMIRAGYKRKGMTGGELAAVLREKTGGKPRIASHTVTAWCQLTPEMMSAIAEVLDLPEDDFLCP